MILILEIFYSILVNQMFVKDPNLLLGIILDVVSSILVINLASSIGMFNISLIIMGIILANCLIFTDLVNEPHCAWIIYSLISGPGLVFAIMIVNNHFLSILNLSFLTLLIFINALFTFPLFMAKPNWTFTLSIAVITIILATSIIPSVAKIIGFVILIGIFLFLQFSLKANQFKQKSNIAITLSLLSTIVLFI